MITSELVQAPGFLDVGERPIASSVDAAITLLDATLNVLPSASFVPLLTKPFQGSPCQALRRLVVFEPASILSSNRSLS